MASTEQRLSPHHSETCWLPLALPPSPLSLSFPSLSLCSLSLRGSLHLFSIFLSLSLSTCLSISPTLSSPVLPLLSPLSFTSLISSSSLSPFSLFSQFLNKARIYIFILINYLETQALVSSSVYWSEWQANYKGNRKKVINLSTTNIPSITKFRTKLRAHLKIAHHSYGLNMMYQKQMWLNRKNV